LEFEQVVLKGKSARWKFSLVGSFLLFYASSIHAQVDSVVGEQHRRLKVLPVPAFGYEPETEWHIGAVALFTLNLFQDIDSTRTSNEGTWGEKGSGLGLSLC